MPFKKNPSKAEKKAATELQTPSRKASSLPQDGSKSLFKSARSLKDVGIGDPDGGEVLEYFHPKDFWDGGKADPSEPSREFYILSAVKRKGKHGNIVRFTIQEPQDETPCWLTMALDQKDGSPMEERQAYLNYFSKTTEPLGPCVFVALDNGYANPFISIQDAIPF